MAAGYDTITDLGGKVSILFKPGFVTPTSPLPPGITFDDQQGVLSGVPSRLGDYEVRFSVGDSKIPSRTAIRRYLIHVIDRQPLFRETFETDPIQFTVNNFFGDGKGLWHLSSDCYNGLPGHSPVRSMYYGRDGFCNYDTGRSEGVVTSAPIHIMDAEKVVLTFKYYLQSEGDPDWDHAMVEVSENGYPYQVIAHNYPDGEDVVKLVDFGVINNGFRQCWVSGLVDLTRFAGSEIRIRFRFRTVDEGNNAYFGFMFDDVVVRYLKSIKADWHIDNFFDINDLGAMARFWLQEDIVDYDLTGDRRVDLADLYEFVMKYWLSRLKYSGGSGSVNNPYRIAKAEDMTELMNTPADWASHFKIVSDIDMSGADPNLIAMIGTDDKPFTGTLNGQNRTIVNLTYPLFWSADGAEIKDVNITDSIIVIDQDGVAVLVCKAANLTMISNCHIDNCDIRGENTVGALVGIMDASCEIVQCSSNAFVSGQTIIGGLVGQASGNIEQSYTTSIVSAVIEQAGVMAGNSVNAYYLNCYTNGSVYAPILSGGFSGLSDFSLYKSCYAASLVDFDKDGDEVNTTVAGCFLGNDSDIDNYSVFVTCFWDNTLSYIDDHGVIPVRSIGNRATPVELRGRKTQLMKVKSTFTEYDWDFTDVWAIQADHYPVLMWTLPE